MRARLGLAGPQRLLGQDGGSRSRRERAEGLLDLAVLEAVEGDHGEAAAGREARARVRSRAGSEPVELAVHADAQGLEGARGGVEARAARAAGRAAHDLGELARGRDAALAGARATMARAMRREARSSPKR